MSELATDGRAGGRCEAMGAGREDEDPSIRVMTGLVDASSSSAGASRSLPPSRAVDAAAGPQDDDPQNVYSSLNIEEESPETKLPLWCWRWLGRILAWRVPGGVVYIGPHWYCSIIMLTFILGVGCFFCSSAVDGRQFLSGMVVTCLSTTTFLRCALANPGVLEASRPLCEATEESAELGGAGKSGSGSARRNSGIVGRRCTHCDIIQPRGCSHCEFCQVCVDGFDHHCPWMGKCIGRKNLCAFYSFIATAMSSLGYIFISTLLSAPSSSMPTSSPSSLPPRTVPP